MPDLSLYSVPLWNPTDPYYFSYDNIPLSNLILRDQVISDAVDVANADLTAAAGNQGSLNNRLAQSININGTLMTSAVDETLHNIAEHNDGSTTLTNEQIQYFATLGYVVSNPVPYVRMLSAERDKLSLISNNATDFYVNINTPSNIVSYSQGPLNFDPSSTITWAISDGNNLSANLNFPPHSLKLNFYDQTPITTDYQNYKTTTISTPAQPGSIRVYINGTRLSETAEVYVPSYNLTNPWTLNSFTPNESAGTFQLINKITSADTIRIDFDFPIY